MLPERLQPVVNLSMAMGMIECVCVTGIALSYQMPVLYRKRCLYTTLALLNSKEEILRTLLMPEMPLMS